MSDESDNIGESLPHTITNRRKKSFRQQFERLPQEIQEHAMEAYKIFCNNPTQQSLRHHALKWTKRSKLIDPSFSVSIDRIYRAVYTIEHDPETNTTVNLWYFIGTHTDYNKLCGNSA